MKKTSLIIFSILILCSQGLESIAALKAKAQIGWNAWYTVTLNDKIPYAYYNEVVEIKDNRVHLQLHIWKKEEGFINEDTLGAFAKNDELLTPLFYNYRIAYKTSETQIDGTVDDKGYLNAKIMRTSEALPVVKRHVPNKVFFSYLFPYWLFKNHSKLKPNQPLSYLVLNEDQFEQNFPLVSGKVLIEKPDEIAKKTGTQKIQVSYDDVASFWYLQEDGIALLINRPANKTLIQKTSKEKALSFLK